METRHSDEPFPYDAFAFSSVDADTFQIQAWTLAVPIAIYELEAGVLFTPAYVAAHPWLANSAGSGSGIGNQFGIPIGQSAFFGIVTDIGASGNPPGPSVGDWFGWVRIFNNGTALVSQDSATALGGQGIIVGTLAEVPEPGIAILLPAVLVFFRRRR